MTLTILVRSGRRPAARHPVEGRSLLLGSAPEADIRCESAVVGEQHGRFRPTGDGGLVYLPLAGPVGTTLVRDGTGRELDPGTDEEIPLAAGDRLVIGWGADRVELEIEDPRDGERLSVASSALVEQERERFVRARLDLDGAAALDEQLGDSPAAALGLLYRMVKALGTPATVDGLATEMTEGILAAVPMVTHVTLFLADETENATERALRPIHMRQRRRLPAGARGEHVVSRTLLAEVVKGREAVLFSDAAEAFGESTSIRAGDIRSSICVPLFVGEKLVGALEVDNRLSPLAFTERELELFTLFGLKLAAALENVRLRERLERAERQLRRENAALRASLATTLVAESRRMREVYREMERVARERLPVLLCGETGTGKELVAHTIHALSQRRDGRFVAVNCAAIPKDLIESELFGHVRGAFTGAVSAKPGLMVAASGGTLFLDEVTELPHEFQAKLLRAVENLEVRPVGSDQTRSVDVRFVAATNRDPDHEVASGRFREDLYYRLNVLRVDLPPLRERIEDIPAIAEHFLARYRAETGRDLPGLSPQALGVLLAHRWPGNVRELRNEIERACVATPDGRLIAPSALSARLGGRDVRDSEGGDGGPLRDAVEAVERRIIQETLRRFDHNISRAAEHLGLSRPGLRMKMSRYGIAKDSAADED